MGQFRDRDFFVEGMSPSAAHSRREFIGKSLCLRRSNRGHPRIRDGRVQRERLCKSSSQIRLGQFNFIIQDQRNGRNRHATTGSAVSLGRRERQQLGDAFEPDGGREYAVERISASLDRSLGDLAALWVAPLFF